MGTDEQTGSRRVIRNVPLLDLTTVTSAEELERIERLENVAVLLVPASLAGTASLIPMENVATIVTVEDGSTARVHTGSMVMPGEGLAPEDGGDHALVVTGLLALTSPVERVTYRQIIVTGLVLAPEGSETALASGLTRATGAVEYYRHVDGQQIRTYSGQTSVGPATLANDGGSPDDVLVLSGQIVITGPVASVGYQRVFAAGQVFLPRDSEPALAPVLTSEGQLIWYDGVPRLFVGKDQLTVGFLELVDEPTALLVIGKLDIADDVTSELLREKISDIALIGKITAHQALIGAVHYLCTSKVGAITARQDAGDLR